MRFREDIEGLRGVAVLLVVLFHTGLSGFDGGYVGVDVFFVVSGYLITAQIVGQLEDHGRVGFGSFWARRLKRLMPLLVVTVLATLGAGVLVYSPLFWGQLSSESLSSILYVSNVQFARDSSFYFLSATSPLLHTWSLSVEEQFYVGWPLILGAAGLLSVARRRALQTTVVVAVVAVTLSSFVVGVLLTRRGTPWAFFSIPPRAWEFGVGALVMFVCKARSDQRPLQRAVLGWLGLAVIFWAAVTFDRTTPMPGVAAGAPVAGTALILYSGACVSRVGVNTLLEARPLAWLGRVSYGWYLFHWPMMVLVAAALQRFSFTATAAAAIASLAVAALAHWFIERPVRHSSLLRRPRVVFASAALSVALVVGCALVVQRQATRELRDPYLASLLATRSSRSADGSGDCATELLASGRTVCVYGDPAADVTVVLLGDSHAGQWAPAMESVAQSLSLRLVVRTRGGCPAFDVAVRRTGGVAASAACGAFREDSSRLLQELRPNLVVLANADFTSRLLSAPDGDLLDRAAALAAWEGAAAQLAVELTSLDAAVAVIESNPEQERDPIECLARRDSVTFCSASASKAIPPVEQLASAEQTGLRVAATIDVFRTAPLLCDEHLCFVQRDGVVNYSDADHLSRDFVMLQVKGLSGVVAAALDRGAP